MLGTFCAGHQDMVISKLLGLKITATGQWSFPTDNWEAHGPPCWLAKINPWVDQSMHGSCLIMNLFFLFLVIIFFFNNSIATMRERRDLNSKFHRCTKRYKSIELKLSWQEGIKKNL